MSAFGIEPLDPTLPEAPAMPAPTTMNATPEQTLLAVLKQVGDLNGQPLIPQNNPMLSAAAALSGFASGVQGRPNPVLKQLQDERELQAKTLMHKATIASTMATIESQRVTRDQAERRLRFDMADKEADNAQKARSFAFDVGHKLTQSDNLEERTQGYSMLQKVVDPTTKRPIIDPSMDPNRLAMMRGKDFTTKWDRAIDIVLSGSDPNDPRVFGTEYPADVFPVQQWKQALATGGPTALTAMKRGTAPTEAALKAEYTTLATIPKEARTPEQARRMEAIKEGLTLSSQGQNTVIAMWKALKDKDAKNGLPIKDDADYMRHAIRATDRSESFERDLDDEADRLKLDGKARFDWKGAKREQYQKAIAEVKSGATPLPTETQNKLTMMRDAKSTVTALLTQFTPQERQAYAGWLNYQGNQLRQAVAANPKFAQFKALIARAQTDLAFAEAGKALTGIERDTVFGWVPTGKEISAVDFEVKLRNSYNRIDSTMEDTLTLATNPKSFIRGGGLTPIQGPGGGAQRLPNGDILLTPGGR